MKMLLVATTALVSVATLAFAGPLPAREIESSHYMFDANQTFLCDYGGFDIQLDEKGGSSSLIRDWTRAAVPVIGQGETVTGIEVANELTSGNASYFQGMSVAIYSSRKNRPYQKLVGATAPTSECGTTLRIEPTQLQKRKKYWIVEKPGGIGCSGLGSCLPQRVTVEWFYGTSKKRKALWQPGFSYCSGISGHHCQHQGSGVWRPIIGGTPYVELITGARKRDENAARIDRTLRDDGAGHPSGIESEDPVQFSSPAATNRGPP
ncbi:MAG TPA: hypothetical protein VMF67_17260 [Rhizomicrobium sp.]|nr:hypothetical protein [Rhizomicrobium sp.]